MERDRERWDQRYAIRDLAVPAPPGALTRHPELLSLLPSSGRAADIACGAGAQALWLAAHGLSVEAFDVSPVAIELTDRAATREGLDLRINARVHDLDAGLPHDVTDIDVLVCQRFRSAELYEAFVDALAPGGLAVLTVLSVVGSNGTGGAFRAVPGELSDAFARAPVDVVHYEEGRGEASIVLRRHRGDPGESAPQERSTQTRRD